MTRCVYCRTGNHELHEQSLSLGQTQPDVVACQCDFPVHPQKKETAK